MTTPVSATPTTAPGQGITAAEVAASVEGQFQAEWDYYQPERPRGLIGPVDITCDRHGEVGFGDVLECEATPLEDREYYPDPFSLMILVTGADGSEIHREIHRTYAGLEVAYETVGGGLFCRDLIDTEGFFSSYFGAVTYWFLDGRPQRMDADRDGIPCETVFPLGDIASFWEGTPDEETTDIHFGYITDVVDFGSAFEFTIDYAFFLGGMEANLAAKAAGDITPGEGVPNDYFIVNQNPRLRTFRIPTDFELFLLGAGEGIQPFPVDPKLWVELITETERCAAADWPSDCADLGGDDWTWYGSGYLPYWIQLNGDTVIRIEEQYLP